MSRIKVDYGGDLTPILYAHTTSYTGNSQPATINNVIGKVYAVTSQLTTSRGNNTVTVKDCVGVLTDSQGNKSNLAKFTQSGSTLTVYFGYATSYTWDVVYYSDEE